MRIAAGVSQKHDRRNQLETHAILTVIGRDQSSVVARVTSFLFAQQANIEGREEKVTRGQAMEATVVRPGDQTLPDQTAGCLSGHGQRNVVEERDP
jgi:predicted amino acid-binding ACT domain protein